MLFDVLNIIIGRMQNRSIIQMDKNYYVGRHMNEIRTKSATDNPD